MCGILALVRPVSPETANTAAVVCTSHCVRHRGPDDEGYLLWQRGAPPAVYAGPDTATETLRTLRLLELPPVAPWRVAFGHRRLSIVDLSPAGHQPMVHRPTGLAVAYNGEIYNHVELRRDLERRGHAFASHCDTEVLLAAWAEWGPDCLARLNGMFAFVLLDPRDGGTLHAVRDRFGVKPLYWARVGDLLAFASEIKQLRSLPGFVARPDESVVRDFLALGLLDHSRRTFDEGVAQLLGGERAGVRLDEAEPRVQVTRWYDLAPRPFTGPAADAAQEFRELLADSVRLRLRADVPVGSCLSGGLDSSAIVCLAHQALAERDRHAGQVTVTARFRDGRYDEWRFAKQVVEQTRVTAVQVWPSVERLRAELDRQLWHMDEPFGSTSPFSQWCVFGAAADAGLKVMLDGQGSDEQLAGYGGNETTLFAGLIRRAAATELAREVLAYREMRGALPVAQLVLAARNVAPAIDALLPARVRVAPGQPDWLALVAPSLAPRSAPRDLRDSLMRQTLSVSLPALLHYEDRNSMARSIEARVPFLDYRLVEFLLGLPDGLKLRRGVSKLVMREGLRGVLPEPIRNRRDKMGFVTPEEVWLRREAPDWFRAGVRLAIEAAPGYFDPDRTTRMVEEMIAGSVPFSFAPWRILCFGRWMADAGAAPAKPSGAIRAQWARASSVVRGGE